MIRSDSEAQGYVDFADGVLGAAGLAVTDSGLRDIGWRFAKGILSIEEAQAESDALILGKQDI